MAYVNIFYAAHTAAAQAQIRALSGVYQTQMAGMIAATAKMQIVMESWKAAFMPIMIGAGIAGVAAAAGFGIATMATKDYWFNLKLAAEYIEDVNATSAEWDATANILTDTITKLGIQWGVDITLLSEVTLALSKTNLSLSDIQEMLRLTSMAARASGEDITKMAELAITAMKAWELSAGDMEPIFDRMNLAVSMSKILWTDFADVFDMVAASAAFVNMSLEETIAISAAVAEAGASVSRTGTGMRRIIVDIAKEIPKYQALLASAGITTTIMTETGQLDITALMYAFVDMNKTVEGQTELFKLLQAASIREFDVVAALIRKAPMFIKMLEAMGGATNWLERQAEANRKTLDYYTTAMMNTISAVLYSTEVHDKLSEGMENLMSYVETIRPALNALIIALIDGGLQLIISLKPVIDTLPRLIPSLISLFETFLGIMMFFLKVIAALGDALPYVLYALIGYKIIMPIVNAMWITHITVMLYAKMNAISTGAAYKVLSIQMLSTALIAAGLLVGIYALSKGFRDGNMVMKALGIVLITITGLLIGVKVATWLGYAAWTAYWTAATVGVAAVVIIGATAAALLVANSYLDESASLWDSAGDSINDYNGAATGATTQNYEFASSLGAINSSAMQQYEVFLLLTEATEGYIYTMGRVITPVMPGGALETYQFGGIVPGPIGMPQLAVVHGGEEYRGVRGGGAGISPTGATISITFGEVHIHEEADLNRFAKRIGKEIQRGVA